MSTQIHSCYKKAALIAVACALFRVIVAYFEYRSFNELLSDKFIREHALDSTIRETTLDAFIRVNAIAILIQLIVAALISMAYPWMKVVMLVLTLIGILSLFNYVNNPDDFNWAGFSMILIDSIADLLITIILFKVPKTDQVMEASTTT